MMIWRWIFRIVITCHLVLAAVMLADRFPWLGSPAISFPAVGALGMMMIFRPWQNSGDEEIQQEGGGKQGDSVGKP